MVKKRRRGRPRILRKSRISKKFLDSFKVSGPEAPKPLPDDLVAQARRQLDHRPKCEICKTILSSYNKSQPPRCSLHQARQGIGDPYALQKEEV
jgi:hypothetical protein